MKLSRKNITSLVLTSIVISSLLSGCGQTKPKVESTSSLAFSSYPIKSTETLKIWYSDPGLSADFQDALSKKTGVKLVWAFPAAGTDANQSFNLMLAGGNMPDIIYHSWGGLSTGPESYIADKYIISLNDYMKYAPNLKKFISQNPTLDKSLKTDQGNYYVFPMLRGDASQTVFRGMAARKDWMDELGIKTPETIADWDTMLRTFKDKKGAVMSYPDAWASEIIVGAYGVTRSFYQDNGKVHYGPSESGYKDFLTQMNKWYKDGILDKDFATIDGNGLHQKVVDGKVGGGISAGSQISWWNGDLSKTNPNAMFIGVPNPVLNKGDKLKFSQMDPLYTGKGAAITTACKNPELAARVLDYGYSDAGKRFWNFGTESVSYTMKNDKPTYTDEGLKNLGKYMGTQWGYFSIGDFDSYAQRNSQATVDAIKVWSTNTDMAKNMLQGLYPTSAEGTSQGKIQTALDTYVKDMYVKFIMGNESLDKFDDYVAQLKKIGLDDLIKLKQNQLDRFNKR